MKSHEDCSQNSIHIPTTPFRLQEGTVNLWDGGCKGTFASATAWDVSR